MKLLLAGLLTIVFTGQIVAQPSKDVCHVYVVDVAATAKLMEDVFEGKIDPDQISDFSGETVYPEFRPTIGEEVLTTKHYPFPSSKHVITASVYYTDESMLSQPWNNANIDTSIIIGVSVGKKPQESAITAEPLNSTVAEVTYDERTNKVRAKQYVKIGRKRYLVGIECDCTTKNASDLPLQNIPAPPEQNRTTNQ